MDKKQLVTLSICQFPKGQRWWAFKQMQLAHPQLADALEGKFYRLMGSGAGNGFSIWPDWTTYALLVAWDNEEQAREFFENHSYIKEYRSRTEKCTDLFMQAFQTHGSWNGHNPFEDYLTPYASGPLAVITRATIKPHLVPYFWTQVRNAAQGIEDYPGHILSKGIGEWPLFMQATISVWENKDAMRRFAYESEQHQRVMKLTRTKQWYQEDMFTEFNVLKMEEVRNT